MRASMDQHQPAVMTVEEDAEYLPKVPRGSVYKLAQRGGIPCQKVGRHWRFRKERIDEWLDSDHRSIVTRDITNR